MLEANPLKLCGNLSVDLILNALFKGVFEEGKLFLTKIFQEECTDLFPNSSI